MLYIIHVLNTFYVIYTEFCFFPHILFNVRIWGVLYLNCRSWIIFICKHIFIIVHYRFKIIIIKAIIWVTNSYTLNAIAVNCLNIFNERLLPRWVTIVFIYYYVLIPFYSLVFM